MDLAQRKHPDTGWALVNVPNIFVNISGCKFLKKLWYVNVIHWHWTFWNIFFKQNNIGFKSPVDKFLIFAAVFLPSRSQVLFFPWSLCYLALITIKWPRSQRTYNKYFYLPQFGVIKFNKKSMNFLQFHMDGYKIICMSHLRS